MESKVKFNVATLDSFNRSMKIAIDKARRGSMAEDAYFLEKLERTANILGYNLVNKK